MADIPEDIQLRIKRVRMIEISVALTLGLACLIFILYDFFVRHGSELNPHNRFEVIVRGLEAIGTLAIFSMLYKENPISRFFEHLLIGVSMGYSLAIVWQSILYPNWVTPIFGIDGHPVNLWWLIAIIPGSLWYFQLSRKHAWISKLIICFFMGVGAGNAFKGVFNILFGPQGQVTDSIKILYQAGTQGWSWQTGVNDFIFFVVTISVLSYFFFSFKHEKNPALKYSSRAGRYFLMIMFGAIFGNTVMGRMSLLIDRLTFMFKDWLMV